MSERVDLLKSVLDTDLVAIAILQAVRDNSGEVVDFRIEMVNGELERQTGRTDLEGKLYAELYPGVKQNGLFDAIVRVVRSGKPKQVEYHYQADGFDHWFQSMFVRTHDGIVATNLDITERKKAELKTKELELKKNKEIFEATSSAQEEERKRIAETLHNGLGQLLYAAKLSVESIKHAAKSSDEQSEKSKALALKLLSEAINETRRISHILSPTILLDFGFKAAIEDTCDQFRSLANIELTYFGLRKLDHGIELILYRSVQELLHNMAKHSKANKCSIMIHSRDKDVLLSIQDNGVGFDGKINKGLGLHTLKSQIGMLQGNFSIDSAPGKGTTTLIHIPTTSTGSPSDPHPQ